MHTLVVHAGTLQQMVIKDRKKTVLVVVLRLSVDASSADGNSGKLCE